jgi:hypothetical protein
VSKGFHTEVGSKVDQSSFRGRRTAKTVAFVAAATVIAIASFWVVSNQRRAAACARWRVDYESAVEETSRAIESGSKNASGSAFERLYRLDEARPGGCGLPVDPNLRLRCLRCGHE